MLFESLNLTPKGKQLLEHKDRFEDIKIGRVIINTTDELQTLEDPNVVKDLPCIGEENPASRASANFGGYNVVGKSLQMNIRIHVPKDVKQMSGKLRIVVMANEDIAASRDVETGMPVYKVFDKQDGTVLGWADMKESAANKESAVNGGTWTSKSNSGFDCSAVITVSGDAKNRCDFKEILAFAPVSGAAISAADILQHNCAFPAASQVSKAGTEETPAAAPTKVEGRKEPAGSSEGKEPSPSAP